MKIQIGTFVKCILRNGMVIEGIVKSWENEVELESLDNESILIIPNPSADILMIKVALNTSKEKQNKLQENKTQLEEKFEDTAQEPPSDDRNKTLAELKVELIKQDRQIIANKLKDHHPTSGVGRTKYGYPGFITK